MNIITGIYKITNDMNDKVYIGQSLDINKRWNGHLYDARHAPERAKQKVVSTIDWEIYKHGEEHFNMEIIEECDPIMLDEKEIYWINFFDSFNNGYNSTIGGKALRGDNHPRAMWSSQDVWDIRELYNNKIPYREAWNQYKDKGFSERSFSKIWKNENWTDIHQDVYTPENKKWHSTIAVGHSEDQIGKSSLDRAIKQDEIDLFCQDFKNGMSINAIAKKYNRDNAVVKRYIENPNQVQKVQYKGISVKNIETDTIFPSISKAAKWAHCGGTTLRNHLYDNKPAGKVPETGEPAHWLVLE